jgi:hypothetical protein
VIRDRTSEQILAATGLVEDLGVTKTFANAVFKATPLIAAGMDASRTARDALVDNVIDLRLDIARQLSARRRARWSSVFLMPTAR